MRYLVVALVAGCGFSAPAGTADPGPGSDAPPAIDAPQVMIDAPQVAIDAPQVLIDAPCPDSDNDGVCDSADLWPCGPQPATPGDPVLWDTANNGNHQTITLSGAAISGTKLRVVSPGATFTVSAGYSILDCICTGCIDQVQVGLIPGTTKKCLYDGNPACTTASTGAGTVQLVAPMTPGVYDVRFRIGQDFQCDGNDGTHVGWWTNAPPAATQTVAKVCVH